MLYGGTCILYRYSHGASAKLQGPGVEDPVAMRDTLYLSILLLFFNNKNLTIDFAVKNIGKAAKADRQ